MGIVDVNTQRGPGSARSLDETFAAVEGIGRELNAVTSAMGDRARMLALKSAERSSAGESPRSLEGVPFAVKDVIDVAGFPTTMGSKVSSGPEPSTTAPVVHLLERAGAIPVAKTNCHEYSYGILGEESAFGRVVNPVDPALCTGGSSSGPAALVAAGVVPLALGTDTAGSVRVPAACQGIIGFKPTFGAVPTEGVFPLSPSFDTVGLFARKIPLITTAFAALTEVGTGFGAGTGAGTGAESGAGTGTGADSGAGAGSEPEAGGSPAHDAVTGDTVTVDTGLLKSAGAAADGVRTWVERHLSEVSTTSAISEDLLRTVGEGLELYDVIRRYEAYVLHERFMDEQGELYQPGVWAKIMSGQTITEADYRSRVAALEDLRASAVSIFDEVDFIITPAIEGDVIRWDEIGPDSAANFMRYALPFNVLGWPAVTLPVGSPSEAGGAAGSGAGPKPESVQIIGAPHTDLRLLDFAAGI